MPLLPKFATLLKPGRIEKPARTNSKVVETYSSAKENNTLEIDFTCPTSCLARQWPAFLYVKGPVVFTVVVAFGMCWGGGRSEVSVTERERGRGRDLRRARYGATSAEISQHQNSIWCLAYSFIIATVYKASCVLSAHWVISCFTEWLIATEQMQLVAI